MVTEAQKKIKTYATASLHYMENALLMIQQNEAGKAGELLWGSVAEALQALALSRGKPLKNHRSLHWFVGVISKELNDPEINKVFYVAENLHGAGFHEIELEITDIISVLSSIQELVKKLLNLIPKEIVNINDIQQKR